MERTDDRTRFLVAFTNVYFCVLACVYLCLTVYGYARERSYNGMSLTLISLFTVGSIVSVYVSKTRFSRFAFLYIPISTIVLCMYAGISWGYDLPSILMMYLVMLIFISLVTNTQTTSIFLGLIFVSMISGIYIRQYLHIENTWKTTIFRIDDILEFAILFIYAAALILFSNREQQKLLQRSLRSEYALQMERDGLVETVELRTKEIKQIQMDHIASMYRFVEFGKVAAGLFHDLMSPLQSLKLKIEQTGAIDSIKQSYNILEKLLLGARQQIRFSNTKETFDIVSDITTICDMHRHALTRDDIVVSISTSDKNSNTNIHTNRTILNHVIYNLIINACEAVQHKEIKEIDIAINIQKVDRFSITIKDTGIGIQPENIEKIFDPFYSSKEKSGSNCGLGLSSSRFCTEKYLGGTLTCTSTPNIGTTMTILV